MKQPKRLDRMVYIVYADGSKRPALRTEIDSALAYDDTEVD